MKKFLSLVVLAAAMTALQGCVAYVYGPAYPGPVIGWHPVHHHWWWDASTTTPQQSADLLAQNYGVSSDSALTIADFAAGTNTDQILQQMGVSASDLAPLQSYEMPSQATIQTIATHLGEDSSKIGKIFSDFVTDAKADNSSGN